MVIRVPSSVEKWKGKNQRQCVQTILWGIFLQSEEIKWGSKAEESNSQLRLV